MNFTVQLNFHGALAFFLKKCVSGATTGRQLTERTSVKDVIESCGVPHPEVDLILANGQPVDFAYVLESDQEIDVYPFQPSSTFFQENRLQVQSLKKFLADCHLGKLVRNLRLLGIDVAYDPSAQDQHLVSAAKIDNRALLTRDRRLLMHAIVRHGYYLRSQNPLEQTVEVLRRFELFSSIAPYTRCLHCNGSLVQVDKAEVIERLEPLTKIYYDQFWRCRNCDKIYWPGSHFEKLETRVAQLTQRLQVSPP